MTVIQFRHAAAAILLKHRPGEYELARRVLGHKNIQTTMNFYCGLEITQANKIFGDIVRKQMTFKPESVLGGSTNMPRSFKRLVVPPPPQVGDRQHPVVANRGMASGRPERDGRLPAFPRERLKRGGAASHMKSITRADIARRGR